MENRHLEKLTEHLTEREWDEQEINSFVSMVGRSALISSESALRILEHQQAVDERIQAERDYDSVFVQACIQPTIIPEDFFGAIDGAIEGDNGTIHYQQRFEGIN